MSTWRSAFLHEFPKGNPRNYLAPPGVLSFTQGPAPVGADPLRFLINPSRWLRYDFNERFDDVIGIDVTIRGVATIPVLLVFPPVPSAYFPIATVGNGAFRLSIGSEGRPNLGRVRVEVGPAAVSFEGLTIPNSFGQVPFTLRTRWHTTGQVHVWWNGELVAYQHSHAAGASFSVGRVAIGSPDEAPGALFPAMGVSHFYVKVLRETDAETRLAGEVEVDLGYLDPADPCWERIAKIQDDITADFRAFMAEVVAELNQAWRNSDGGQPFSSDSLIAHKAADAAFRAFLAFVRTGNQQSADEYLIQIKQFLSIVAAAKPDAYKAVLQSLEAGKASLPAPCVAKAQDVYDANLGILLPLRKLMDETNRIATDIAEGL